LHAERRGNSAGLAIWTAFATNNFGKYYPSENIKKKKSLFFKKGKFLVPKKILVQERKILGTTKKAFLIKIRRLFVKKGRIPGATKEDSWFIKDKFLILRKKKSKFKKGKLLVQGT